MRNIETYSKSHTSREQILKPDGATALRDIKIQLSFHYPFCGCLHVACIFPPFSMFFHLS